MSGGVRLRVATFNLRSGRPMDGPPSLGPAAELLRQLDPDITGLQEIWRRPPLGAGDQPAQLRRLLGRAVTFLPSFGSGPLAYGNALVTRAPVRSLARHRLPGPGEPRALLEAGITLGRTDVRVFCTHLEFRAEARLRQAERVADRIASADTPALLLADCNAEPPSEEIRLLEAAGLVHCVPPDQPTFPSDAPSVRIDYIMATWHFRALGGRAVPTRASDHLPLVADLLLEE